MPTCSTSSFRAVAREFIRDVHIAAGHSNKTRHSHLHARSASTAAAFAPKPAPPAHHDVPSNGAARPPRTPLTTIHHTASLLKRILPPRTSSATVEPESLEFWEDVLDRAQDELSTPTSARGAARIVVRGVGDSSYAEELVSALVGEPFTPRAVTQHVRERWRSSGTDDLIVLYAQRTQEAQDGVLPIRSSWLQQFQVPVEIHELPSDSVALKSPSHAASLLSADIPIIVCNPLTTTLSDLLADSSLPLTHSNAILVLISSSTVPVPANILQRLRASTPESLTVLVVDPSQALRALDTLNADPNAAVSVQRYQDEFSNSNISSVTAAIKQRLSALHGSNEQDVLAALRKQNALDLVSDSLNACRKAIKAVEQQTALVRKGVSSLESQMEEFKAKVASDILGPQDKPEVKEALERAKLGVKQTMDRLTSWRMVWKVDDIADTVNASIDRSWCRHMEDKLIFQTGRLSVTQNFLGGAANRLISSFPKTSSYHSPVLQNTLAQLRSQPSYNVHPGSLTPPIHSRRAQLTYPTNALHQSAQHAVLGMGGSVLSGIGIAWAGWAEQLGLLGMWGLGLGAETAAGLGLFTAVAGVWYSSGRWDKAKKRWWRDWDRVGEGLERDLQTTLDRVVTDQVLTVPSAACKGLRETITRRADEVAELKDEVSALEEDCVHR